MMKKIATFSLVLLLTFLLTACDSKMSEKDEKESYSHILIDDASILIDNPQFMQQYIAYNEQLLKEFDVDFRVITTLNESDIDLFSNDAFRELQKESRSQSGKALLMVVNIAQDKVRLEVSMALEPIYTDAYVSYVERKGLLPYFRDNKVADGIYMMTELMRDRAFEASEGKEFMPAMESKSIGAGAKTKANLGIVDPHAKKGDDITTTSSDTPKDILDKHIYALKTHNKNPNLEIYSDASKAFFKSWTVTDINMNNEYRFINQCTKGREVRYSPAHDYAVAMNHPVKERTCSPYFFKKEHGKWTLDIATMAKVLRFNAPMQWHFDMGKKFEIMDSYEFAFVGLYYDKNGYPLISKNKNRTVRKLRWGFTCGDYHSPKDPEGPTKCWIRRLKRDGLAKRSLGLAYRDRIISAGEGKSYIENVSADGFMKYMKEIQKGQNAVVTVMRNSGEVEVLRAVAP